MTTPIKLRENIVGVVLPDEAREVKIICTLSGYNGTVDNPIYFDFDMPTYKLICLSNSATEEEATLVVFKDAASGHSGPMFNDYSNKIPWLSSARKSLQSLLKSIGLEGKNVAILEIIK